MTLLVIGRDGQLARSLADRADGALALRFAGRPQHDLTAAGARDALLRLPRPAAIINTAAYTAVDRAESERDTAFALNADAVAMLAGIAADWAVPLIHLSTDYVFAGSGDAPHGEDDACAPAGVYGASKLAGEAALAASDADYAIVRTAWLYSPFGSNFVRTMLRLARQRDEVGVVADQTGNPTSALDLADALLAMAARWPAGGVRRVYHFANAGAASWADLAEAVFAEAAAAGLPAATVRRIATADYPTPAQRPANSRLTCARIGTDFGIVPRDWRAALAAMFARGDAAGF